MESSKPQRGSVACKRCRRLRAKCNHDGRPPCASCCEASSSVAAECVFPKRGERDLDRTFRAKPQKIAELSRNPLLNHKRPQEPLENRERYNLPPHKEIVEGFRTFVTSYFQLGFIPKAVYLERLTENPNHLCPFLLLTILGISARFTPALIQRYGSASKATKCFLRVVEDMIPSEMYEPSLERVQAFFLLSISEWGDGDKNRSSIHMGIAVRMAALLKLHREETYKISEDANAEDFIATEMARRTFWMIQSQDNLHSGHGTPLSFSPSDITALLPSDESDFVFGTRPAARAALPRTPPALSDPSLVFLPTRSLFATLIQAHNLWGMVARRASRTENNLTAKPWEEESNFMRLSKDLYEWEDRLPERHRWSTWNLRGYRAESQDLAYLSIVMVIRLSNIVLRRVHLDELIQASRDDFDPKTNDKAEFWQAMSSELFYNVVQLHKQIEAYFPTRPKEQGYPAILVFCIYVCGSLASHLWTWPQLCPQLAGEAEQMAIVCSEYLADLQHAWPAATRWLTGLVRVRKSSFKSTPQSGHGTTSQEDHGKGRQGDELNEQITTTSLLDVSPITPKSRQSTSEPVDNFEPNFEALFPKELNYDVFEGAELFNIF